MASSPSGQLDPHDWRRLSELLLQGVVSVVLTNLLTVLPMLNWGKYAAIQTVLLLLVTEAVKRFVQSPSPVVPNV